MSSEPDPPGWLPKPEYDAIFSRVARLCVEVVIAEPELGVLLALRDVPPNQGAWHIPGGTVLFGERVTDAVKRVARRELGLEVEVDPQGLLGYIEYPSHYENGIDSPVGLAFRSTVTGGPPGPAGLPPGCRWFKRLPDGLYAEQRDFLRSLGLG